MSRRPVRRFPRSFATLAVAVVGALGGGNVLASGFQLKENDALALGRAFAGSTAAPGDAAVVVNNPAAMSEFATSTFQADVTVINFATYYHGGGTDAIGQPLAGGHGGDGGTTKPVPAMFFLMPVGDRFRFGAAISAPFGFVTEYKDNWIGRYSGLKSDLQTVAVTLSGSWAVTDEFSLGLSAIAQRTKAELTSAVNFGAVLAANPNLPPGLFLPQSADGFAGIKGDDWGYGWQLGLLWKPTDSDRIGFSFRSEIDHTLTGDARFVVPAAVQAVFDASGLPVFQNTGASAKLTTPKEATLSWWHTLNERISFGADISYTGWSSLKGLVVDYRNPAQPSSGEDFDWNNTLFGSVGMDYRLNPRWTVRGGLAYDQTPTHTETRTARVPDGDRTWLSVGLTYEPGDTMSFSAGYVYLIVDDARVGGATSATGDRLVGRFESEGNLLGISGQLRF
jgi:long-chain fatty acid transport protein